MDILAGSHIWSIRRIPSDFIKQRVVSFPLAMPWLVNSVFAWWCLVLWTWLIHFFEVSVGVLWVLYLQWHQLPSWVSLLYLSHPCCLSFSLPGSNEVLQKKKLKRTPMPTSKCYCYRRHLEVRKLKIKRFHSIFSPTLRLLLSHLAHSDEGPNDQDKMRNKDPTSQTTKEDDRLPTSIAMFVFISLLLASSFFESRDEIPCKGVDLSHPEISNFKMWIERIIK
jgi:hypothetical protein